MRLRPPLSSVVDLVPAARVSEDVARAMGRAELDDYEASTALLASSSLWRRAIRAFDVDALPLRASLELALIRPLGAV
jgi:hypothetical protein